jgi:hypothetical protein
LYEVSLNLCSAKDEPVFQNLTLCLLATGTVVSELFISLLRISHNGLDNNLLENGIHNYDMHS